MLQFTEQTLPVFNHSKVGQGFAAGDNTVTYLIILRLL